MQVLIPRKLFRTFFGGIEKHVLREDGAQNRYWGFRGGRKIDCFARESTFILKIGMLKREDEAKKLFF